MHYKLINIITADVTRIFRLDPDKLFELKLEYGLKYLAHKYPAISPKGADWQEENSIAVALRSNALFWNWWSELWAERDRVLMTRITQHTGFIVYTVPHNHKQGNKPTYVARTISPPFMWDFYQDYHYWLMIDFYPNEVLIRQCMESLTPDPSPEERGENRVTI